jgi:hypothetical protein
MPFDQFCIVFAQSADDFNMLFSANNIPFEANLSPYSNCNSLENHKLA